MIENIENTRLESRKAYLLQLLADETGPGEKEKLNKALEILHTHCGEMQHTDDSLFERHPVEVAISVVEDLGLGYNSVLVALLHILPNHCDFELKDIEKHFGKEVAGLIEEFLRISSIRIDKPSLYSDNFRNLLLSLVKDIRVILIKLIDRVHMMRTLGGVEEKARKKISNETFYLYAPLAHRLGLYRMKTELEDNAMKHTHPEIYQDIQRKLKETKDEREKYIQEFIEPIQHAIKSQGFDFEIKGRSKSVFSIWQKMKKQNVDFEQVYDVFAIRIILNNTIENEKADCWKVYSILTDKYTPNPTRLRDWVTVPKATSGYESLHTTVKGPANRWVEVQIRTRRMDDIAEKGQAAHWKYKEGSARKSSDEEKLKTIREILEQTTAAELEEGGDGKIDLYKDTIFVFTPDYDLKKLQAGSTVLDFAYHIHSKVGEKCTGAIINNKNVPIRYELQNGDMVKVLTSKNQKPAPDWVNYVISNRTRTKIKRSLRQMNYQHADAGKAILMRKLNQLKMTYSDEAVNKLIQHFKVKTSQDLYEGIGNQDFDVSSLKDILQEEPPEAKPVLPKTTVAKQTEINTGQDVLLIDNESINDYKLANCCKPVFGDDIFGFVTVGEGVKIHRTNCPNARQLKEKYSYRIIEARWYNPDDQAEYLSELKITGADKLGMVSRITDVVSGEIRVNMQSINFSSSGGVFTGYLVVHVTTSKVLDTLINKLRKMPDIDRVIRIR
ncbi:MAG: RelA/SpoT family protein [Bacteroidota bacterium]